MAPTKLTCFKLLQSVLDEVWAQLPGTEDQKVAAVRSKGEELRDGYKQLTTTRAAVNYLDPATRYAYLCCYVSSHANMVAELLGMYPNVRALFENDKVQIACIGGGPGSDLLGVLKFVDDSALAPQLKFFLYDREQAWSESWSDVDDKLGRNISTYFQPFDVTDSATWAQNSKYLNSDLFTFIYFASEIHRLRDKAAPFFRQLFERAKPGATFLYIDNASPIFFQWFDEQWKGTPMEVLASTDDMSLRMPNDEQKTDLGAHYMRMDGHPKLSGRVAVRILRKKP
jgi:hypothetical protein